MANCIVNIYTKNYQIWVIGFQVTVKNVGDAFLGQNVVIILLTHSPIFKWNLAKRLHFHQWQNKAL